MLVQSFTARMPLLTATSAFGLGRRCGSSPQPCYLRWLLLFSPAVNVNWYHGEQNRVGVGVSGDGCQLWQSPHGTAETVRGMIWFEFQFESRFVFMSEFRKHWVTLITVATFARKYFKVICIFLDHLNTAFVFFTHHFQGESVLARYHHCFTPLLLAEQNLHPFTGLIPNLRMENY